MSSIPELFEPCKLGDIRLANRIVMAPMTRSRAHADGTPSAIMIDYYRQRASAGLIIAEGTYPAEEGRGYCRTPGIVSEAQVEAWRHVVDAVHQEGGKIVLQLMHCGRCSHADNKRPDAETVAPSAIRADGEVFTEAGMKPFSMPRALRTEEVPLVVEQFRQATANAYAAGFDGVELHGASGYLPAQFLSAGSNRRTDRYGGSLENRVRFSLEVLEAMCSLGGAGRVGLRICPGLGFNDVKDPNPRESTEGLLNALRPLGLAYLHVMRASPLDLIGMARDLFGGPFIVNGGYRRDSAARAIVEQGAAAVSFASAYIANPDLVRRLREALPLSEADPSTFYTPGPSGYSDYPAFDA